MDEGPGGNNPSLAGLDMDEEKSAALRAEFEEKRRAPKLKFGADYYENRSAVQKEWDEGLDMGAERSEALRGLNANGRKAPSRSRPAKVPADPELLGQIFDLFDYDQSGHIEEKEGLAMAFYLDKTDMEKSAYWARLLSKMDTDGDSRISRDEYIAFHKEMTHTTAAELKSTLLNKGLPKVRFWPSLRGGRRRAALECTRHHRPRTDPPPLAQPCVSPPC